MGHKDPVTAQIREWVLLRDRAEWLRQQHLIRPMRGETAMIPGCVATFLAPSTSGPCWGRLTLDHIKDQPRMGKRAPSDPDHLVSLCEGHTESGALAGFQWNTANRQLLRWYLRTFGGES